MPVTFDVDPTKVPDHKNQPRASSIFEHVAPDIKKNGGLLLKASNSRDHYLKSRFANGFVGACIYAYNLHYHLVLGPDEVWIAIVAAFSRYVNSNAEKMREHFVDHQGQLAIKVTEMGVLETANYESVISTISDKLDEVTKGEVRSWVECDFSTTTPHSKTVSKLMLMSSLKEYFKYNLSLLCGLPKVTLNGTEEDWKKIQARVQKLSEFEDETLSEWAATLDIVLEQFIAAFSNKVDKDFWNRIAHYTGGGSGPRYLEGWVLAFVAFDEQGEYFLNTIEEIKETNKFGTMGTGNIPSATVQVPLKITNPDGIVYDTRFYAGAMLPAAVTDDTITPAVDWALAVVSVKDGASNALPLPKTPFSGASVWSEEFVDEKEDNPETEAYFSKSSAKRTKKQKQNLKQKQKQKQKQKPKHKQKCIIS